MPEIEGKKQLLSVLRAENDERWTIITELAQKKEPELRRLLRPHAELEVGPDERQNRKRLDTALVGLTQLEVGYETGVITINDVPLESIPQIQSLQKLFQSEAFLRYVNAYLYFGIRFLAGRMPNGGEPKQTGVPLTPDDLNQQRFSLEPPPLLDPPYKVAEKALAALLELSRAADPGLRPPGDSSPQVVALNFLDGFTSSSPEEARESTSPVAEDIGDSLSEAELLELWLRGLYPEISPKDEARFTSIRTGLNQWALDRHEFYLSLHGLKPDSSARTVTAKQDNRPPGGWVVTNPLVSRFALLDLYWIAGLLRADVLPNGSITYARINWLSLLRFRTGLEGGPQAPQGLRELRKTEEVLRSVFDFVCDLLQNATEITKEKQQRLYEPVALKPPHDTVKWRKVFDEELDEIEKERDLREYRKESIYGSWSATDGTATTNSSRPEDLPQSPPTTDSASGERDDWMERLRREKKGYNLIGLCFSGGGIRSATFNLGVLQGLQELDLLRKIDYVSTVSGGGYIGSWLVANVCRTKHWLGRLTNWDDSIDHLRRYSNYLAPRLGVFSADTWTMWTSWARNALLIQLTGIAWLWFALLLARFLKDWFVHWPTAGFAAATLIFIVLFSLAYNLSGDRAVRGNPTVEQAGVIREDARPWSGTSIWYLAVFPAWCASFSLAAWLWEIARKPANDVVKTLVVHPTIQDIKAQPPTAQKAFAFWVLIIWVALALIAFFTLSRLRTENVPQRLGRRGQAAWRIWHAFWISSLCAIILLFELRGILRLFADWSLTPDQYQWYAYIFGPPIVLAAHTIVVVLFIGLSGRHSKEAIREWWSRFGAALARVATAYLVLTVAAIFGPSWILYLLSLGVVKWSSIITWVATVVTGLLAGKSTKTSGNGPRSDSRRLELLAKVGGFVFIVGAILLASTMLYIVLAVTGVPGRNWHRYWETVPYISWKTIFAATLLSLVFGLLFSRFFEINIFGLNQFYRFRLVRCYLGATRWAPGLRRPQPFTNFDGKDDMQLNQVLNNAAKDTAFRGPFPIFNCALNLAGSSDLALHTRHSASFSLTPKFCGADRRRVGYSRTSAFANGVMLGQAVAISGAAASPNMGFNTSPLVAFLLTMFNVRLGWWFPNPGQKAWYKPGLSFSLYYLLCELFGVADESRRFVNVSDGGHFENLGIYELVRRRCKVIIVCDAECDEFLQFGSLGRVVRMCETDFGAKIDINVSSIRQKKDGFSLAHSSVGTITYSNGSIGHIIYLKASISGDEDVGITQYRSVHSSFPHETTADQFFSEDQFESYRRLGLHIVRESFQGCDPGDHPVTIAERLADVLAPAGCSSETFLKHTTSLDAIWERFRNTPALQPFFEELIRDRIAVNPVSQNQPAGPTNVQDAESLIGLELIQLMENVFLDLRLDDFWSHPDNRGWAILFMRWARSPRFRAIWNKTRRTFGIRFEYFCEARLGLQRDRPIVRV